MIQIILANGNTIGNLSLTGGENYFSETPIDESLLTDRNLSEITVIEDELATKLYKQHSDFCGAYEDGYSFNIRPLSTSELLQAENTQLHADIDYLLMITEDL